MDYDNTVLVGQITTKHEGMPEETLMKMAAAALKAIDVICVACQGKIDESNKNGQEIY